MEKRPVLTLLVGLPGAGKTTLAKKLERETGAIRFTNEFEHAVFTKERLLLQLNRPGSSQAPKPAPAPKPAAPAPEGGTASPEARTESKTE